MIRLTGIFGQLTSLVQPIARVTVTSVNVQYGDRTQRVLVSSLQYNVLYRDRTLPPRTTAQFLTVQYRDRRLPPKTTAIFLQALISNKQRPGPIRPVVAKTREINPYKATAPLGMDLDLSTQDYLREQSEHLREQHNKTQAGDSTFPWEELTKIGNVKFYTLGSLGRFYHDDYGIIHARYVQYSKVDSQTAYLNGPAGFLPGRGKFNWVVTNQLSLSSPELVAGIIASYTIPAEGDYGWLIVDGPNITSLQSSSADVTEQFTELGWVGFETVGPGVNKVLGRVLVAGTKFDPGSIYISVEGISRLGILELFRPQIDAIQAELADLQAALDVLQGPDSAITQIVAINKALVKLAANLEFERNSRIGNDSTLQNQINAISDIYVTVAQLNLTLAAVSTSIADVEAGAASNLAAAILRIQRLEDLLAAADLDTMAAQIRNLLDTVANLKLTKLDHVPIGNGDVPPALMCDADGRLIFVEF